MFCTDLRTDSGLCFIYHWLTGLCNRGGKCLQRGTDWFIIWNGLHFVFKRLNTFRIDCKISWYLLFRGIAIIYHEDRVVFIEFNPVPLHTLRTLHRLTRRCHGGSPLHITRLWYKFVVLLSHSYQVWSKIFIDFQLLLYLWSLQFSGVFAELRKAARRIAKSGCQLRHVKTKDNLFRLTHL
jgi:hypothetical protein